MSDWSYVLGIDLGYEPDPTAFVVAAYHPNEKCLYFVEASKETKLDVTAVAERIKALDGRYDFERMVIDNSAKQAVEEMKKRHGLALHPADKTGKVDFIELMNGDFIQGYIKLLPEAQKLKEEYAELIWDDRSEKRQEHSGCANHCTDAALYAWRYCYSYLSEARKKPTARAGTADWHIERTAQHAKDVETQYEKDVIDLAQEKREREEAGEEEAQFMF